MPRHGGRIVFCNVSTERLVKTCQVPDGCYSAPIISPVYNYVWRRRKSAWEGDADAAKNAIETLLHIHAHLRASKMLRL